MPHGFRSSLVLALFALLVALAACSDTAESRRAPDAQLLMTELKFTIRADQVAAARALLGLKESGDTRLEVSFYDTPALELHEAGLILRSRHFKGRDDDVTVKLRPLARSAVAASWFALDDFKCEEDRSGAVSVESCSFSVDRSADDLDEAARGKRSIKSLFSDRQQEFIRTYASLSLDWGRLKLFGPIPAKEWEFRLPELDAGLAAELWTLPDGRELLELSTKVPRPAADATLAAIEAALASRGLEPVADAPSKTRAALEAFAAK